VRVWFSLPITCRQKLEVSALSKLGNCSSGNWNEILSIRSRKLILMMMMMMMNNKNNNSKLEFVTWLEQQVSLQSPRKRTSRYMDSQNKMSGNDSRNRYVFSLWRKSVKEEDD